MTKILANQMELKKAKGFVRDIDFYTWETLPEFLKADSKKQGLHLEDHKGIIVVLTRGDPQ